MENMLHGYDVLPTAVHLTASTLALLAPEVTFRKMNLYVMPMGLDRGFPRLGSLDFLDRSEIQTQMALDNTHLETYRTGVTRSQAAIAELPKLDLCVMNPPFVRSVNSNLLFGSLPQERAALQKELKERAKFLSTTVTAGLGAVFVALADKHLKPQGRLAFVLPHALASGEAWSQTRSLISANYELEYVITSHDPEHPNFSENTSMSELLFVAKKTRPLEESYTTYINLWKNPATIYEAVAVADKVTSAEEGLIRQGNNIIGERLTLARPKGESNWTGAMFASGELAKCFAALTRSRLLTPEGKEVPLLL
jgi:hypothetical protein